MPVVESLLTTADIARLARVSKRTVHRWMREQRLPAEVRLAGPGRGAVRFRASDIDAWIRWGCPSRAEFERMREAEGAAR